MPVPFESMLCMGISALLAIGVPIALLVVFHRRYGAKFVPALVGVGGFVVFALVLEQLLHVLVLRPQPDGTHALMNHPILYMLYGSFAAGIFEETARFVSYHALRRKYRGVGTALAYGVGHGGIEAILLAGVTMLMNLITVISANSGGAALDQNPALAAQIQALAATPSYMFLISGLERMSALAIQISLSVLVFYAVYENRRVWLYPLAILLHAAVDAPAALMQAGVFKDVFALEGMVIVFAILLAFFAVYTHRRLEPASVPETIPEVETETVQE